MPMALHESLFDKITTAKHGGNLPTGFQSQRKSKQVSDKQINLGV
jgi:hypothetical protein